MNAKDIASKLASLNDEIEFSFFAVEDRLLDEEALSYARKMLMGVQRVIMDIAVELDLEDF